MTPKTTESNEAWKKLLNNYDIISKIHSNGIFRITADQIREVREPRLMAKWDSSRSLPQVFKQNKINILPDSRSSYVLGEFSLYQEIPELLESITDMSHVDLPEFETINITNITSEANAINVLVLSGILEDFLQEERIVATFNGRMGTGNFDFRVNTVNAYQTVQVNNAQCEIDGGFENDRSVIVLEAKNVVYDDFHVRQLYFPYRLWKNKVNKPIRLVFSVYSNMIFRLFEYRFTDIYNYSSIELVNSKNYSLENTQIELIDLIEVRNKTEIKTDDNQENNDIPFIQANSIDRIISLLENLYDNPMSEQEVAVIMKFETRQSSYYYNAGKYLGIFEKKKDTDKIQIVLTSVGVKLYKSNYRNRQLQFVALILKHRIFADCFDIVVETGDLPSMIEIEGLMRKYNVCGEGQVNRRASSIKGWLKWVFNLTNLN